MTTLLEVSHVTKVYGEGGRSPNVALQEFSLSLPEKPARIVSIAGESGSGKSTLAGLVLGFVTPTSGEIRFRGQDVSTLRGKEKNVYRQHVQAVFQDPYAVFNPFYRVRHVFDLVFRNFSLADNRGVRQEAIDEAFSVVGLNASEVLDKYPHQLSGGQRQRLMMARAYIIRPDLIIADEPVSMVDASLRMSILDIMRRMRDEDGISFLYITHDLATAYQVSDEIAILYQGSTVEAGQAEAVLTNPKHPYVQALIGSIPEIDSPWADEISSGDDEEYRSRLDSGCRFAPRCPVRLEICERVRPELSSPAEGEPSVACHLVNPPRPPGE